MPKTLIGSQAQRGEKMLEIRIKLWTDRIANAREEIVPKHAWDSGIVYMPGNKSHDIKSSASEKFHTLLGLPRAIESQLLKNHIQLHLSRCTRKYYASQDLPP
jgi:hypothetical protein